jgi:serine/threonine protein kinase
MALGTPGYMAPEQASGTAIDHRADVFALAIIAYRCLTGRPAFWGEDPPRIMFDIVFRQPMRPSDVAVLDEDVDRVLALALTKKPADRIDRAEELARLLALAVRGRLTEDLRERADIHVARYPWGARIQD